MNTKPIIIALVGPSGSGKTTLSLYLEEHCDIPAICSYTTRPMRIGEVNGREHWFVGHGHPIPKEPLAYTFFGGYHYWAETSDVDRLKYCTYVIDEAGLSELLNKWGDRYDILSVYIERPDRSNIDTQRTNRDLQRPAFEASGYDIVLYNNSDLRSFLKNAITTIAKHIIYGNSQK